MSTSTFYFSHRRAKFFGGLPRVTLTVTPRDDTQAERETAAETGTGRELEVVGPPKYAARASGYPSPGTGERSEKGGPGLELR